MKSSNDCVEERGDCCVSVRRDCSHPDSPTVSSDCGIHDRVVQAWSTGSRGRGAPWGVAPTEVIFDCCECRDC
jgi:hypothetical protein